MKKPIALTMLMASVATTSLQAQVMLPYQNPELSFHDRAVDLVSRLSLEEKAWQMGNMVDQDINRADYQTVGGMVTSRMREAFRGRRTVQSAPRAVWSMSQDLLHESTTSESV